MPEVRHRGLRVDPERLNLELAARGLHGQDIARLAGVSEDTITRLRQGRGVDRASLLKVVDALSKQPAIPLLAKLVGGEATP